MFKLTKKAISCCQCGSMFDRQQKKTFKKSAFLCPERPDFLDDAREDKEIRRELGNAVRESSAIFNNALTNISASMNQLGNSICKSIEMLAQAMVANQPYVNQNTFSRSWRSYNTTRIAQKPAEKQCKPSRKQPPLPTATKFG